MAGLLLPPDYFRTAAEQYKLNPTDRKKWLEAQLLQVDRSLLGYQELLAKLANEAIQLGAAPGESGIVAGIGGVLAAIPAGFTQVVGGLLLVGGAFFGKLENKEKQKDIARIQEVAIARLKEAELVAKYKTEYQRELFGLRVIPYLLAVVLIWLITKM